MAAGLEESGIWAILQHLIAKKHNVPMVMPMNQKILIVQVVGGIVVHVVGHLIGNERQHIVKVNQNLGLKNG